MKHKRNIEEVHQISLEEVCVGILSQHIPEKQLGPSSFTIPRAIGSLEIDNALPNLGASVN